MGLNPGGAQVTQLGVNLLVVVCNHWYSFCSGITWYYFVIKSLYDFPVVQPRSEAPRSAECAGLGNETHSLIRQLRKCRRRLRLFAPPNVLNYNEQLSRNYA
jgi:hypothetical protein